MDERRKRELEALAAGILVQERCSPERAAVVSLSCGIRSVGEKDSGDKDKDKDKVQRKRSVSWEREDGIGMHGGGLSWKAKQQIARSEYRRLRILELERFQKKELERVRKEKEVQKEEYTRRMAKAQADVERKKWQRMEEWERQCSFFRVLNQDKREAVNKAIREEIRHRKRRREAG